MRLSFCLSESTSELLNKHRETFCRTEEQDGIYFGNIHALIEHVNDKEIIDFFPLQAVIKRSTHLGILTGQHISFQTTERKLRSHVFRMLLIHTETERPDITYIWKVLLQRL